MKKKTLTNRKFDRKKICCQNFELTDPESDRARKIGSIFVSVNSPSAFMHYEQFENDSVKLTKNNVNVPELFMEFSQCSNAPGELTDAD